MAFGHEDTDKVYDKVIKALLKEKNIIARRVDKIVHNDDINFKITQEIIKADFTIADLTYARPSVYYEAGFAERTILYKAIEVAAICTTDSAASEKIATEPVIK